MLSFFDLRWSITEEAREAGHIKTEEPIMIVLWNPPYSGVSTNTGDWITAKIEDYKYVDGVHFWERKHWLQDDYVKFFRLSESLIEKKWEWILAFITNHGYIDNPTFRWMRWHLLQTFDEIYIVDLHGNSKKKETAEDGTVDQNVFDIQQWVSIFLWVKTGKKKKWELGKVYHTDIYGKRDTKYNWLSENDMGTIMWKQVELDRKFYFFCPKDFGLQEWYNVGFGVQELFPVNVTWIVTARDGLVISENRENLLERMKSFFDENKTDSQVRSEFFGNRKSGKYLAWDSRGWQLTEARKNLLHEDHENNIQNIAYRPFDERYIYYHPKMVDWGREKFMKHMFAGDNIWLTVGRQWAVIWSDEWNIVSISKSIVDFNYFYRWWEVVFPLYLYSEAGTFETGEWEVHVVKTPNLDEKIWKKINKLVWEISPDDILDYIYAVLHSKIYRETYKEFLKIDFPKIPYPKDKENFFALVELGREIRSFHLLENPKVWAFITNYPIEWDNLIEKVKFQDDKVFINNTQYFSGISKDVFEFQIWGYKPAEKYLKDRKGRSLNSEEFENYQKMIVALSATIRIMEEIDKVFKV